MSYYPVAWRREVLFVDSKRRDFGTLGADQPRPKNKKQKKDLTILWRGVVRYFLWTQSVAISADQPPPKKKKKEKE